MDGEKNTQKPAASFTFLCKSCGLKIRVAKSQSGKKGRCPRCKNVLIIPSGQQPAPPTNQAQPTDTDPNRKDSLLDPNLFDIPKELKLSPTQAVEPNGPESLDALRGQIRTVEPEPVVERQLPWFVDIFLYPTSLSGVIHLVIFFSGMLLLLFLSTVGICFPRLFLLSFGILVIGYFFYYLADCVRDSAAGSSRAPGIEMQSDGLDKLGCILAILRLVVCLAVCLGPFCIYFLISGKTGLVFWLLLTGGAFFFPMILLATILFDSYAALNPVLIIASIFSAFLPYLGMALLFYGIAVSLTMATMALPPSWPSFLVVQGAGIYVAMILANILGRFYWQYKNKLNWEV